MPRLPRIASTLVLLLHLAVAGLLPLVDGTAEGRAAVATSIAHIEGDSAPGCPMVHDEQACQVCSLVRLAGQPGARVVRPPVARELAAPASILRALRGAERDRAAPDQARAPPVA